MTNPEFKPGLRFSVFDALLLLAGASGAWFYWSRTWWLAFVIACVVGHFFLFCNVFRIARSLELIWAFVFIVLIRLTVADGLLAWPTTLVLTLATTLIVIGIELRKPSYHGIAWRLINPNLPQWWATFIAPPSRENSE